MATALREQCPSSLNLEIDFLSCGSRFEYQITNAGFNIIPAQPRVKGVSVAHDLGWDWPEFFGSEEIAKSFIDGQLAAFRVLKPDIVFHGMWAPASIAARLLGIRTINFLPVPLHPSAFAHGLVRDLPDMMPLLTRLPRSMRQSIAWWASGLMTKVPIFPPTPTRSSSGNLWVADQGSYIALRHEHGGSESCERPSSLSPRVPASSAQEYRPDGSIVRCKQ
jgi:hypothetical protein